MLSPNTILRDRYRIIHQLGQGGMGAVYQAMDESPELLSKSPDRADYHNLLGRSLEGQNRLAEAEAEYKEAVRLNPDYDDYQNNLQRITEALKKKK